MTFSLALVILFSSAYASVSDAGSEPDVMRLLTELQTEVRSQNQQISSLQAEVASQKTRILILEELVDKQTNSDPVIDALKESFEKQEDVEESAAQVVTEDKRNNNVLQNSVKGRIRQSELVPDAEGPIAFQAHLNSDITHISIRQKIMFDAVSLNLGNGYHSAHGLFIAPRPGIYIFSGSILAHHTKDIEMTFMKNGASLGGGILAYSDGVNKGFDQGSATVVAQLNTGDEVWIENNYPDDTSIRASAYTCFMGCLIMQL